MSEKKEAEKEGTCITIDAPKFVTVELKIIGTAPLVINKFSNKSKLLMHGKHEGGSTEGTGKGKKREKKDFAANCEAAKYKSQEGWCGINAAAFRCAMISACRIVDFKMTLAKLCISIIADGYDKEDGTPLVKITKGEPEYSEHVTRNANGSVDLRARPMWRAGWEAIVTIRFDGDRFTQTDVVNLMARVGAQVGICEGRPDSKKSSGMGWGVFRLGE